jgi:hypothetical protein
VLTFIGRMKRLPIKTKVPNVVTQRLTHSRRPKFWRNSSEGWSPYRADVILFNIVYFFFSAYALFIFLCRLVLDKVQLGIFPLLFIGVIVMGTIYKCNVKIQQFEYLIITRK